MPYLTKKQISELNNSDHVGKQVIIKNKNSSMSYEIEKIHAYGMKGVVWRVSQMLGRTFALKVMPESEYDSRSLLDEMTMALRLKSNRFADILFFGELNIEQLALDGKYKAIVTEWVEGEQLDKYLKKNSIGVDEFLLLATQLCECLAALQSQELCHDDLHPGNILVVSASRALEQDEELNIKVIDTGTVKSIERRTELLSGLRERVRYLEEVRKDKTELFESEELKFAKKLLVWKEPDDHLRAIESLLHMANTLIRNYYRLDAWERKFTDGLQSIFAQLIDPDLNRRMDSPRSILQSFRTLQQDSKSASSKNHVLSTPFDYISAEMIRDDKEFSELFSKECPWLDECATITPLYVYGPRGCGKSSILRWLSFKSRLSDSSRERYDDLAEIGIYISCSVELRSRFWLFDSDTIDELQADIIAFFSLLLLEELFDTLSEMHETEKADISDFGLLHSDTAQFASTVIKRMAPMGGAVSPRLQGQNPFKYLRSITRREKWDTWSCIQMGKKMRGNPDPALVGDISRLVLESFSFFDKRHLTLLLDDYSNQRIPKELQIKLNQTISFAKQGVPIFKVSSEYQGVDLNGIEEGREVIEINIGEKYTQGLENQSGRGPKFLSDIVNIRLKKANYDASLAELVGPTKYDGSLTLAQALAKEATGGSPFYYHGIDCINWLCSGDVALALDLVKKIFDSNGIGPQSQIAIPAQKQHKTIHNFAQEQLTRIRYIAHEGDEMYQIIQYLGSISRANVANKKSKRFARTHDPKIVTHLDVSSGAIDGVRRRKNKHSRVLDLLISRAILVSLSSTRSRKSGEVGRERFQMRRIYFPAFLAPLNRDVPITIDSPDELLSLLSEPKIFAQRELAKVNIDPDQLLLDLLQSSRKLEGL